MNPEMMRQLQQLQARMAQAQKRIEETKVEASVGGGMVTVVMNARPELIAITIKPEVADPAELEMLQDLVLAAVNEGLEKVRQAQAQHMAGLTNALNLPGLSI